MFAYVTKMRFFFLMPSRADGQNRQENVLVAPPMSRHSAQGADCVACRLRPHVVGQLFYYENSHFFKFIFQLQSICKSTFVSGVQPSRQTFIYLTSDPARSPCPPDTTHSSFMSLPRVPCAVPYVPVTVSITGHWHLLIPSPFSSSCPAIWQL